MTEDTTYGDYLRRLRTERGLRLRDIAEILDVSVAYVSDVERGTRAPFADEDVIKVARFLGVPEEGMVETAHRSKSRFVLDGKDLSPGKRDLAAKLVDAWDTMDDNTAREIMQIIE